GPLDQRRDVRAGEDFKREDLTATQERRIDGKEWVLRRRADEDDAALFNAGEQDILLGAVESVDLIEEQNGTLAGLLQLGLGFLEQFPYFLDPRGHGIELLEMTLRVEGDDLRQRGLSRAGRAVEDERAEPVCLEHAPQELAG